MGFGPIVKTCCTDTPSGETVVAAQVVTNAEGYGENPMLDALLEFLWAMPAVQNHGPWPARLFDEPFVLRRAMVPRLFAAWARGHATG